MNGGNKTYFLNYHNPYVCCYNYRFRKHLFFIKRNQEKGKDYLKWNKDNKG